MIQIIKTLFFVLIQQLTLRSFLISIAKEDFCLRIFAGQAAIDLAIQTNTAIVTTVDGKIVRITAAELINQRQLTS